MNKFLKDADSKKLITILTTSGILISSFIIIIVNYPSVKAFLGNLMNVLAPFIWGTMFALIMIRMTIKIETILPDKIHFKTKRFIASLMSTLFLVVIITVSMVVVIPSLLESINTISVALKNFANDPSVWIENLKHTLHLSDELVQSIYTYSRNIAQTLWAKVQSILPSIIAATMTTVTSIINFVIGFIICLYILIDRRKIAISIKRFASAVLDEKAYVRGRKIMYLSLEKFTNFFSGKVLDSVIVGLICFAAMLFINVRYAGLIAIVIGITNIVPFFGPFIGAVPCALILLIVDPLQSLMFIVLIVILQQIDGNIIGPRILGDSVGISSLLIMFAIIVGGSYFGFFGMLLGVPIFSVFYYIVKEYIDDRLEEKNKEADE